MGKFVRFDFLPWNVNVWPKTGQSRCWHTLKLSLVFSDFNFRTFLRKLSVHPVERSPPTNSAWNWNLKSLTRPQHSHCAIIYFGWFWAIYLHFHREKSNLPYLSIISDVDDDDDDDDVMRWDEMQTYNKSIKSDNLQLIYKIIHTTYKKSIKTYNPLQPLTRSL